MALYFISAASGTGKATLMNELRKCGEEAYDTDTECIRRSNLTGEAVGYERTKAEGYDWIYPSVSLQTLNTHSALRNIFLLGTVDNFDEVISAADEFI